MSAPATTIESAIQAALATVDDPEIKRPITDLGMVRSVETVPGSVVASGAPLVRLQDCDRAFLTVSPDTHLVAGEAVQVKLPNLPLADGTVRASAGIMEPPNALVVTLATGALAGACPVGAAATVIPLRS